MKIIYAPDCWKTNPIQSQSNPKQSQYKPNSRKARMKLNFYSTKDYERNDIFAVPKNKANSNPIYPYRRGIKPNFKGKKCYTKYDIHNTNKSRRIRGIEF